MAVTRLVVADEAGVALAHPCPRGGGEGCQREVSGGRWEVRGPIKKRNDTYMEREGEIWSSEPFILYGMVQKSNGKKIF